jgi:TM2 domain-containing membrane protein YozV
VSDKSWGLTFFLCFFTGLFGGHRFYVGKYGTGVMQLISFGGFGWWMMFDLYLIASGKFRDAQGMRLLQTHQIDDY